VRENIYASSPIFILSELIVINIPFKKQHLGRGKDIKKDTSGQDENFSSVFKRDPYTIKPEELFKAKSYNWNGNIRQIKNYIEKAYAIGLGELKFPFDEKTDKPSEEVTEFNLEKLEKKHIKRTLEMTNGNKTEAAKLLGIDKKRLYRKLEKYGIKG